MQNRFLSPGSFAEHGMEFYMKLKKVALVGAGAVGAWFISLMQEKMGENFIVLAEGERKERLLETGLKINGREIRLNVKDPQEAGEADLLLIATKYNALGGAARQAKPVVGAHTTVLSLLNGIDSEQVVGETVGEEHVVPSFMRIISARRGQEITFDEQGFNKVIFGEWSGEETPRVLALKELFDAYGVSCRISRDIRSDMWNKYAINIANNMPQAVLGVGYGAYFDSPHVKHIHQKVMDEVFLVAKAENIVITAIPTARNTAVPATRFSTLQDLDAKRPTETEMLLGVFLQIAKKHGIEVPYCEYTYHALKALEEKNEGKLP